MRFAWIIVGGLLGLWIQGTQGAHASDVTQIVCTGRTNDGQSLRVRAAVKAAPELSHIEIQLSSPEVIDSVIEVTSESDGQGHPVLTYRARLDAARSFAVKTSDQKTGLGMIQVTATVRAPLMSCVMN